MSAEGTEAAAQLEPATEPAEPVDVSVTEPTEGNVLPDGAAVSAGEQENAEPEPVAEPAAQAVEAGNADEQQAPALDTQSDEPVAAGTSQNEVEEPAVGMGTSLHESLGLERDPNAEDLGPFELAELAHNQGEEFAMVDPSSNLLQEQGYEGLAYDEAAAFESGLADPTAGIENPEGYIAQDGAYDQQAGYAEPEGYAQGMHADNMQSLAPDEALAQRLVAEERERHEAQMKLEARAREELEDMILRIEKHFKAEQAARKKAEELLQSSIAAEMENKAKVEDVLKKRAQEQRALEDERAAVKRERLALENMRKEFEAELQAARSEVAKAQEALAASEERIRATEQLERARLEADYQGKLASMGSEVERMREELGYRTAVMGQEMEKWRQQATLTANAVLEAKNEVLERKKELDATKEKMDRLLDKLYIGRERGIELSGAIESNQRLMSYMPGGAFLRQPGAQAATATATKLPPLAKHHPQNAGTLTVQASAPNMNTLHAGITPYGDNAGSLPSSMRKPAVGVRMHANEVDAEVHGSSRSDGHLETHSYGNVQSKFANEASARSAGKPAARQPRPPQQRNASAKNAKPDRFAEAEKEKKRLAGMMNSRWN